MNNLGEFLKEHRQRQNLSLKDVYEKTGITDSRLSRIERGDCRSWDLSELKNLISLYGIDTISAFIAAGLIDRDDLKAHALLFTNTEFLTEEERNNIQATIDLFVKGRGTPNNEI